MAKLGDVLFNGSRFIFWALSPFLVFLIVGMPLLVDGWWPWSNILVFGLDAIAALLLLALYDNKRFWWASRGVTGVVFLAYLGYLVDESRSGKPWRLGPRSEESPVDALLGLLIIGLPSLRYTLAGRFSWDRHQVPRDFSPIRDFYLPCPHCSRSLNEHEWTDFAGTAANKESKLLCEEFLAKAKARDWRSLRTFPDWEETNDNLEALVFRCPPEGVLVVFLVRSGASGARELRFIEEIPYTDMAMIEDLRPGPWCSAPRDS
jgi:hypothetical protein